MENENFDCNNEAPTWSLKSIESIIEEAEDSNEAPMLSLENFERNIKEAEDSYGKYLVKKENAEKAAKQLSFIIAMLGSVGQSMGGTSSSGSTNNPNSCVGDVRELSFDEWTEFSPEERAKIIQLYESRGESLEKWRTGMIVFVVLLILGIFIFFAILFAS